MLTGEFISLYNTTMKLFFIASSAYILYLMKIRFRWDYLQESILSLNALSRPTNDPSIDTFRLEFLLGPCAVIALIFNYKFNFTEVSRPCPFNPAILTVSHSGTMGILHLFGGRFHSSPAFLTTADWRS